MAAIAQLRSVLRLRAAAASLAIRVRLEIAAADLAMLAAWCSYDVEQHEQARRLWTVALELCRHTEHPRAADLAVDVLLDIAHQSLHLMRPDEALRLAGFGFTVESNSPGVVSDATRSYIANVQSWSYAVLGDITACERALGRAEQHFAAVDPGTAPSWAAHVDFAEFAAQQGHAWYLLSVTQPDAAARAVPLLAAATGAQGSDYARTRAVNLAGLAGSYARADDIDAAVNIGRRALEEISRTSSVRAYRRLRMLDDCPRLTRLSRATPTNEARAGVATSVTRWIADHGGPALAPTSHAQPVREAGTVATLWPYLPSPSIPRARDLARAVRELHDLDAQPPALPVHQPLARLYETLDLDTMRDQPVLPSDTREWLLARASVLKHAYDTTTTPLGRGLIHGDVQPDNLLQDRGGRWLLIDWDRASHGPRELDLAFAVPDHFHESDNDRAEFSAAYGDDSTTWTGWTLIRDLTELHSLANYIRRATTNPAAHDELHRRVDSLVNDERSVVWHSVSD
ncbi:MAG: aminoglycoside phosphotransferase family protein [Actinobacteria bacterium]|nr:aminoglycoside phosphotransferase family protein [Actinomycetota bacterium]